MVNNLAHIIRRFFMTPIIENAGNRRHSFVESETMTELVATYGFGINEADVDTEHVTKLPSTDSFAKLSREKDREKKRVRDRRHNEFKSRKRRGSSHFYSTKIGYYYKPYRHAHWMLTYDRLSKKSRLDSVYSAELQEIKDTYLGEYSAEELVQEQTQNVRSSDVVETNFSYFTLGEVKFIAEYTGSSKISNMVDEIIRELKLIEAIQQEV